jgi:hypothetical protein
VLPHTRGRGVDPVPLRVYGRTANQNAGTANATPNVIGAQDTLNYPRFNASLLRHLGVELVDGEIYQTFR